MAKQSQLEDGFLRAWKAVNPNGPEPVRQHQFAKAELGRKWAFDFAWVEQRIAVECEGATWTGGRHTRGAGFQSDIEKYNAATLENWSVLRCTATDLKNRPIQFCEEVAMLINRKGVVDSAEDAKMKRAAQQLSPAGRSNQRTC